MPPRRKISRKQRARRPKPRAAARGPVRVLPRHRRAGEWFARLVALQARLRDPGGCPWDREQTHASLRKFLIEETYEVLDAMDSADSRKFSGELGDLLLQVVFNSKIAEEAGEFTLSDVIQSVHDKLIRRHPHVFGNVKAATPGEVLKNWEHLKAAERAAERAEADQKVRAGEGNPPDAESRLVQESLLSGVPRSLPAVLEAYQLTRRAAHAGFDWENLAGVLDKLDEEKQELRSAIHPSAPGRDGRASPASAHLEEEVGDLLFVAVNVARFLGVDPEIALKKANRKFKERFQWMESAAAREGRRFADLPRARMEELWNESKLRVAAPRSSIQ